MRWMSLALSLAVAGCGGGDGNCENGGYFLDADGDTYGDPNSAHPDCLPAQGYVNNDQDCDDTDPEINPQTRWYADGDGDGYGASYNATYACLAPPGFVSDNTDCDDGDASLNPGSSWFEDLDLDGYGSDTVLAVGCDEVAGATLTGGDCDDLDETIHPDAQEICDEIDQDCDGDPLGDEEINWYVDSDGDGYGDPESEPVESCDPLEGRAPNAGDCDDMAADYSPEAYEICDDGIDQDCDGIDTCGIAGQQSVSERGLPIEGTVGHELGRSVSGLGDIDGDGFDDVVVGIPGAGVSGQAQVVPGAASGLSVIDSATLEGGEDDVDFGSWVGPAGDVNNDGYADVLVGSPGWGDQGQGALYVFFGPLEDGVESDDADYRFYGSGNDWTGIGRRGVGDSTYLLTTASYRNGTDVVGLIELPASGTATITQTDTRFVRFEPTDDTDYYPLMVDVGDIDGDGVSDIVMGNSDYGGSNTGGAFVFYGASDGFRGSPGAEDADVILTARTQAHFGADIAVAPDLDGDGLSDVVVGAPGRNKRVPYVYVFSADGLATGTHTSAEAKLEGDVNDDERSLSTGASLGAMGDLTGDGIGDLVIGSPGADQAMVAVGPLAGNLVLSDIAYSVLEGDADTELGAAVAEAGDVDADGYSDFILGAPGSSTAYVFLGGP